MRTLGIRWRLTIWNCCILSAILAILGGLFLVQIYSHLSEHADAVLKEEIGEIIEELHFSSNRKELLDQLERRFASHSHFHFQIFEEQERVFQSRFLTTLELPTPEDPNTLRGPVFRDIRLPQLGRYRMLSVAVRDSESRPMLFRVLSSQLSLDREIRSYLLMMLALGPIAVLCSIVGGYSMATRMLSPIKQMGDSASRISGEATRERIMVPNRNDEIGFLANTLNQTFDRIESTMEEMQRFTSDAAHELRSPIAVLRTHSEVILRQTRSIAEYQNAFETILSESRRLGKIVDQLLILSKHDAGIFEEAMDEVPLDAVIRDVLANFEFLAKEKRIEIRVEALPEMTIHGSDIWLSQLFSNLIDNALKFTPEGGMVRIAATRIENDAIEIAVEDSGIGISNDHLPHLFERFYRVDASREHYQGTGLGLAICKSIVAAHRGTISVESTVKIGTRFMVQLPLNTSTKNEQ